MQLNSFYTKQGGGWQLDLPLSLYLSFLPSVRPKMLCRTQLQKYLTYRVMNLYRNVGQHVQLCTWSFTCAFIQYGIGLVMALDLVEICNFQSMISLGASVSNGNISSLYFIMISFLDLNFHIISTVEVRFIFNELSPLWITLL